MNDINNEIDFEKNWLKKNWRIEFVDESKFPNLATYLIIWGYFLRKCVKKHPRLPDDFDEVAEKYAPLVGSAIDRAWKYFAHLLKTWHDQPEGFKQNLAWIFFTNQWTFIDHDSENLDAKGKLILLLFVAEKLHYTIAYASNTNDIHSKNEDFRHMSRLLIALVDAHLREYGAKIPIIRPDQIHRFNF